MANMNAEEFCKEYNDHPLYPSVQKFIVSFFQMDHVIVMSIMKTMVITIISRFLLSILPSSGIICLLSFICSIRSSSSSMLMMMTLFCPIQSFFASPPHIIFPLSTKIPTFIDMRDDDSENWTLHQKHFSELFCSRMSSRYGRLSLSLSLFSSLHPFEHQSLLMVLINDERICLTSADLKMIIPIFLSVCMSSSRFFRPPDDDDQMSTSPEAKSFSSVLTEEFLSRVKLKKLFLPLHLFYFHLNSLSLLMSIMNSLTIDISDPLPLTVWQRISWLPRMCFMLRREGELRRTRENGLLTWETKKKGREERKEESYDFKGVKVFEDRKKWFKMSPESV